MTCRKCARDLPDAATYCPWCGVVQSPRTAKPRSRSNGEGSVWQASNGTWTAQVTVGWKLITGKDGKQRIRRIRRTKKGLALKRDAIAYLPILRGKPRDKRTLHDYWTLWSRDEMPSLSASKQTAYTIAWRKLADIALRDIAALTVEDLRAVVRAQAPTYYPARDIKTLLTHLYALAGADGTAKADMPSYIHLPKLEEKEQQPFSQIEIASMWTAYEAGDYDVGYILTMIYSGMMPGELRGLGCDMIDLAAQRIAGAGIKTKERKRSYIAIADVLVPVIAALMERSRHGKLLPISEDSFYRRYYAALDRCGCRKLPPYSCRHSTATALAVGLNIAPEIIRKVMRWSSSRMLDRYAHPGVSDALGAVNALPYSPMANDAAN